MSYGHVKTKTLNQYMVYQIPHFHYQIRLPGYIMLVQLRCCMVITLGVAWSFKDKDSKSVHGLPDHRPSLPNTGCWVYNVGSP